jgi:signal transduction histidine kinase
MLPVPFMSHLSTQSPFAGASVSREEFEEFLNIFTHEIRNRLNIVSLEASDLAEQLEGQVDIARLQGRVRDCSEFLKLIRDQLVPENPGADKVSLSEMIAKLRARELNVN